MNRLGALGTLPLGEEIRMVMILVEVEKEVDVALIPRGWLATDLGGSRSKACLNIYMQIGTS